MGEKALAPVVFSQSPTAGFQVPETWQSGNCAVSIEVEGSDVEETSTFAAIVKRAHDLMLVCVIQEPHLGGRAVVGDRGRLKVSLYGAATSKYLSDL